MLRMAITDRLLLPERDWRERLLRRAAELAASGVDFLLVREKDLPGGPLAALCREIVQATGGSNTRVLVSSRIDVATACGLAGVHLSGSARELPVVEARAIFRAAGQTGAWVSVSCHTLPEVRRAREAAADAVLWGPVFGKSVRGEPVAAGTGLNALRDACAVAGTLPVFALGGITRQNAPACAAAGARGWAAIREFFGSNQPAQP